MLIGTSKRLKAVQKAFTLVYNLVEMHQTFSYKYLGSIVDSKLSLNENYSSVYKKELDRLRLLSALKRQLDTDIATTIYNTMVVPPLTALSL